MPVNSVENRGTARSVPVAIAVGTFACALSSGPVLAVDFRSGPVVGRLDLNLSYGALYRTENRNPNIIAIANGGTARNANIDDGTLNYDEGIVSSMVGSTGDLTLDWGPFTAFARGIAFYDFEQEEGDREHRPFTSADLDAIGSDVAVRDFYLNARFSPGGMPLMFRVGDQVINWGETTFVRDGVDTINPLDILGGMQPARSPRDARVPQGMAWAAANLTKTFAVEAYYQYEWQPVTLPPAGYFLSISDVTGAGGRKWLQLGDGLFSDRGTDLDEAFALPAGTLGFDPAFLQMPQRQDDKPEDGGQYGLALTQVTDGPSALKWGVHYVKYHSRLPLIGGVTAAQSVIDNTDPEDVARTAGQLVPVYESQGLEGEAAREAAENTASQLVLSQYSNAAGYYLEYPEDITMIAATFNTATLRTGTLVAAEFSHHMDVPMQLALGSVVSATLSPVRFNPGFGQGPLGSYGADTRISGFTRLDRSQLAFSMVQILGPRLGANQTLVGVDGAFVHVHDFPGSGETPLNAPGGGDPDSWGYRLFGQLQYNNVFGAANLAPRIGFAHDVHGYTPAPFSAFWEGRKALALGLSGDYLNRMTVDLAYTMFLDGGDGNPLRDRDFVRFNFTYWF